MAYKPSSSSKPKRQRPGTGAEEIHRLKAADRKTSGGRAAASIQDTVRGKEILLTTRRQLRNAVAVAQQTSPLTTAANESKDAKSSSFDSGKRKGTLLTTKRQLRNALALSLKIYPVIAEAKDFKRRNRTAHRGAKKAGHQSGKYNSKRSSKVKADKTLTPTAARNVEALVLYTIKDSSGKGLGMFAAEDIRKGTRILAEKPFFCLTKRPVVSLSDRQAPNEISEAFDHLSTSEQRKYLDLHCPERPGWSRGFSIYEANCYEMGPGTCICLDASRINHSCISNAHYAWNSNIERETVHAVKDISKDEEITISYCSTFRTLDERKRELEPYVFACSCPACQIDTSFGIQSQVRRQQMRDLGQQIADHRNDPSATRMERDHYIGGSAIRRLVNLIEKEGLVYEKSWAYRDAAEYALKRGLREEALVYASKELEVVHCCVGRDSPYYDETMDFVRGICFSANGVAD